MIVNPEDGRREWVEAAEVPEGGWVGHWYHRTGWKQLWCNSRDQLREEMIEAGWPVDLVTEAFN